MAYACMFHIYIYDYNILILTSVVEMILTDQLRFCHPMITVYCQTYQMRDMLIHKISLLYVAEDILKVALGPPA